MRVKFALFTAIIFAVFAITVVAQTGGVKTPTISNVKLVDQKFLTEFADAFAARLKGKSVGFALTAISNGTIMISRVGGDARRAPDPNPRKMTATDQFNIASVSKTITAAAALKAMNDAKVNVDSAAWPYLPSNWTFGPNFKGVTLRELLTHRSGIRCAGEVTYAELKTCVAVGIKTNEKVEQYNNSNIALFRMIIPRLVGFSDKALKDDAAASKTYAKLYYDFVQTFIFKPIRLNGISLTPDSKDTALAYQFPGPVIAGTDFGDMFETSASRGWRMDTRQLALLMDALLHTDVILPRNVSKRMMDERLGLWPTLENGKVVSWEHGGYYPGKNAQGGIYNAGEMNSLVMTFPNGVSVAAIVNSQYSSNMSVADAARAAMKDALAK